MYATNARSITERQFTKLRKDDFYGRKKDG